jgi:hypothetical protein
LAGRFCPEQTEGWGSMNVIASPPPSNISLARQSKRT